jgi:hypothetical protein
MDYSDVVYGIFAFFWEKKEFTTERIRIHNGFYKLANIGNYRHFFSEVTFSSSEEFHESIEIDQCIDNLILSRLITASNPDLVKYQISTGFYKYYEANEERFFSDNAMLIKEMSKNLYSMVGL